MISRLGHFTKTFVVLLSLLAWFDMSNHCALASLRADSTQLETCCAQSEKNQPAQGTLMVCCQKLQTTEQASLSVPPIPVSSLAEALLTHLTFIVPLSDDQPIDGIHLGAPPAKRTVASIDLQRCHPAFAPPLFI